MTISTYGTALRLEISTRLISVDGGFATALDTTDHVGRRSRRLPMRLALLGEADAVTLHGRMSDLGLTTDCDFGGMTEAWQQAGSGGYALIFMLEPSSTRSEEIAAVTNVDFLTSGQDDLAAHGLRNRVCLRFGCTPEKNRIKNLSAQKTLVATAESTGREGSEASARTEGVWWYCASAALEFANIHVQDQLAYGNEDLRQPDIEQHAGDGRPVGCAPVVPWITALVCSSYVSGAGIYYGRVFLPLGCQCQLPCREARFSGSGRFAGPALRLVSGCHLFARKRGTPGTIARPPGTLLSMAEAPDLSSAPTDATMDAAKSGTRYSATVASFHLFELPEASRTITLAHLFQQDISFPMSGPFYICGDTEADANQLTLRMTRAATSFTLLLDVGCSGPASTAMERLLRQRQQIFSALKGIDGPSGRSVKAGASPTFFSSLTVDDDGRAAASGSQQAELAGAATHSFSHRLDDVAQL